MLYEVITLFGEGRGISDFLVVTIEHGVGLGIVIDGSYNFV